MEAILVIWLLVGIFSSSLTVFVVLLLAFHKTFIYSFYRLITVDLSINILCWVNTWPHRLVYRPEGLYFVLPIREYAPLVLRFSTYLLNTFFHIQSLSTIVIRIHRLTTTIWKNANKFWSKWYLGVYLGVLVASGLATSLVSFRKVQFDSEKRKFISIPLTPEESKRSWWVLLIFTIAYLLIIVALGIATYWQVRKKLSEHSDQYKGILRRLSYITIIHAIVFTIILSWQLSVSFVSYYLTVDILMTVSDVVSFSMTFIMVILDKNIRAIVKSNVIVVQENPQIANGNTIT